MATALDLQEQEQIDELKAFWKRWGNLVTWIITAVLLAYAGYNAWNWYQRDKAGQAAAMYEELDKAAAAGDADKTLRIFNDLKERHPGTLMTDQGALRAAKVLYDKGKADQARLPLEWAAEHAELTEHRALASLRLAGLLLEAGKPDAALAQLDRIQLAAFAALAADRRGDVLLAQGKAEDAKAAYRKAYEGMDERVDYRRLIEAKLMALGAPPVAVAGAASAATTAAASSAAPAAASKPASGAR